MNRMKLTKNSKTEEFLKQTYYFQTILISHHLKQLHLQLAFYGIQIHPLHINSQLKSKLHTLINVGKTPIYTLNTKSITNLFCLLSDKNF